MSDAIAFACESCGMRYSVAPNYAGRQFACKKCGAGISVPSITTISARSAAAAPKVELDSGEAVMRKSDSGRTSARKPLADPTRVFTRQTAEAAPPPPPAPKSKAPLIAVVVAVVIIGGGVAAGFALGVFGGKAVSNAPATAAGNAPANEPGVQAPKELSPREKLLAELKDPNLDAMSLIAIWDRAGDAGLSAAELKELMSRIGSQVLSERGAGKTPDELIALGDRFRDAGHEGAANSIWSFVVESGGKMRPRPDAYAVAHARLGRQHVDFEPALQRATVIEQLEVLPSAATLRQDLEALRDTGVDGWVTGAVEGEFRNLVGKVEELEREVERLRTQDPFRLDVAEERRRLRGFELWKLTHFLVIEEKPFLLFVERKTNETDEQALERVSHARAVIYQFTDWYRTEFADPVGLTPAYPSTEADAKAREGYPHTYVMLRDTSRWNSYLRDAGYTRQDHEGAKWFIEPGTGRMSTVYVDQPSHLDELIDAVAETVVRRFHPRAPSNMEEAKVFRPYGGHFVANWIVRAMKQTSLSISRSSGQITCTFFNKTNSFFDNLKRWAGPYEKGVGMPNAFGGHALTIRQMMASQTDEGLAETMAKNLKGFGGWTADEIEITTTGTNFRLVLINHGYGLFMFLWHQQESGKFKYRSQLVKLLHAEMQTLDREGAEARFAEAFRLKSDADWKQLQDEFAKFQQQ